MWNPTGYPSHRKGVARASDTSAPNFVPRVSFPMQHISASCLPSSDPYVQVCTALLFTPPQAQYVAPQLRRGVPPPVPCLPLFLASTISYARSNITERNCTLDV